MDSFYRGTTPVPQAAPGRPRLPNSSEATRNWKAPGWILSSSFFSSFFLLMAAQSKTVDHDSAQKQVFGRTPKTTLTLTGGTARKPHGLISVVCIQLNFNNALTGGHPPMHRPGDGTYRRDLTQGQLICCFSTCNNRLSIKVMTGCFSTCSNSNK